MVEQFANFAWTTLAGNYTAGGTSLHVSSSTTGSGIEAFPGSPVFSLVVADQTTKLPKALFQVTAIPDGAHFTTTAVDDANCVTGDLVYAVVDKRALQAYIAGITSGGLVLLDTKVASSSATLDFTGNFTSLYDEYVFKFINVIPATSGAGQHFQARLSSNGGSTWISTTDYYWGWDYVPNSGTFSAAQGSGDTRIIIFTDINNTVSNGGLCGSMEMFNPLSTTMRKHHTFHVSASQAGAAYVGTGYGILQNNAAMNGIRFYFPGNMAQGIIRMYGVTK